ncbi:MAG: phosphatase PAP2 family protein [Cytophagaceae bacterium]|nr:phosphatase PAP2 family protein [Cytophagaceae bacterium]
MKRSFIFIIISSLFISANAQGPYKMKALVDGPIILGGAGLSLLGLNYLKSKPNLDSAYVVTLKPEDVNKFDRGGTRQPRLEISNEYSNYALYAACAVPLFLYTDKNVRSNALKIGMLYIETMTIMANVYVWGVGSTYRKRPWMYNPEIPLAIKTGKGARDSFFAGHPAAAAAATFFAAKVFSDYNPDCKLRPFIFGAAVIPPAVVAYYRYKYGAHFPTDILVGIPVGAAIGIIVPHLHKGKAAERVSVFPAPGGAGIIYKL